MEQKQIRDFNDQRYSKTEGASIIKELDDRTKHDVAGFNSMAEIGTKVKNLESSVQYGVKTYQTLADLPDASGLEDAVPAKVANDGTASNNGYYSVYEGVWVKDADFYENTINPTDINKGVTGFAVNDYLESSNHNPIFKKIKIADDRNGLIDIVLYNIDQSKTYRLSRCFNYYNAPDYRLLIEIKDSDNIIVCWFYYSNRDDIRKSTKEWIYLTEQNSSGISGYAYVDFKKFLNEGILTFNYEFNDKHILSNPDYLNNQLFSQNSWLKNIGQKFTNRDASYGKLRELEVINAIQDIYVPSPDITHINDDICLYSFENDNGGSYNIEIRNNTTGEVMSISPTLEERTAGKIVREMSNITGFRGLFLTILIDYGKLINTGTLITTPNAKSIKINIQKPIQNQWRNKKIVWLGTSIPENQNGTGSNITEKLERSYPNLVGRMLGCDMRNLSRAGIASSLNADGTIQIYGSLAAYVSEYNTPLLNPHNVAIVGGENGRHVFRSFENSLLGQKADLYVFDLVPNNVVFDTSEWNKFNFNNLTFNDSSDFDDNRKTYLGSILFLYNKLMLENPLARVVFVTEYPTEHLGVQNTITASEKLNIPMINLREKLGADNGWHSTNYIIDGVHPSQYATYRLANMLFGEFLKLN